MPGHDAYVWSGARIGYWVALNQPTQEQLHDSNHCQRIGGRRCTDLPSLQKFCAEVTAAADGGRVPTRSPAQRQLAIERSERELQSNSVNRKK